MPTYSPSSLAMFHCQSNMQLCAVLKLLVNNKNTKMLNVIISKKTKK